MTLPKIDQLRRLLPRLSRHDAYELDDMIQSTLALHTPGMPELDPFRAALLNMQPAQVRELRDLLEDEQKKVDEAEKRERLHKERFGTTAAPSMNEGTWTLRQEKVLCGKGNCQKLHGPYWYGYRTIGQKVKKRYFGKKRPSAATLQAADAELLKKETERFEAAAAKAAAKKKKKARAR